MWVGRALNLWLLALVATIKLDAQIEIPRKPDRPTGDSAMFSRSMRGSIDAKLLQRIEAGDHAIRVFVILSNQPHREVLEQHERSAEMKLKMLQRRLAAASEQSQAGAARARADLEALEREVRQRALDEIRLRITLEQDAVEQSVRRLGGRQIRRYSVINMLEAELPATAIPALSVEPAVLEIGLVEKTSAQLATSVPSLGATAFWNAGYRGAGEAVAVLDSGLRTSHPVFSGLTVVSRVFLDDAKSDLCFGDNALSALDYAGHGTQVMGVVASRGAPSWTSYLGMAPELGVLYNLKTAYYDVCTQGANSYSSDIIAAIEWAIQQGVRIFNYSYGSFASDDDSFFGRTLDYLADTWGLSLIVSAGNYGPAGTTLSSAAAAYNVVSVANMDTQGTTSRDDDVIATSSSRGPTPGGRKKPDLSAPGTPILTTNHTNDGFVYVGGTSFAAPHIAGAAALLRQAGVRDSLAIKALLLNTTDQLTWSADKGWGYTNLSRAGQQVSQAITSTVPTGSYRLFRSYNPSLFYATLAWNRWVYSQYGSGNCLSDLDLVLYGETTNSTLAGSMSWIDNVEKAYTYTAGGVIVKVKNYSGQACAQQEKVGLAASAPVTPAIGPMLAVSCSGPAAVVPGGQFTVTCTARNQGDLTAFGVQGPLNWVGQTGGASQSFGDLGPGAQVIRSWSVTAPISPGSYSLRADVVSQSFGEVLTSQADFTFQVVNMAPAPVQVSPAYGSGSSQVFTFSFTDPNGWQDLSVVNLLFNFWLDGRQACYLAYLPSVSVLYLVDDAGNAGGPYQGMTLPGSGSIGNSQCTVYGSGSSVNTNSGTLTLNLNIAFRSSFAGSRLVYVAAADRAGSNSGWQRLGVWNVPGLPVTSPAVVSMTPQWGSGAGPQAFTIQFYDADGYQDLNVLNILVNDWLDGRQACYLAYVRPLDGVYLVNDAGSALSPLLPLGTGGSVANSQCVVYGTGSSVSVNANYLTLTLNLGFKTGFSGRRVFYVAVRDAAEHNSGWQAMGTWTVP